MPISILPATLEDADKMIDISIAAFAQDKLYNAQFYLDIASPEQLAVWRNWRAALMKARMDGPGKHWFKAIDDSNESIVGYCGLYAPEAEPAARALASLPLPTFMNHDIYQDVRTREEATKVKWIDVHSMAVDPGYQGQSIARKLLQRGLDEADKRAQDVYLEGTPAGLPLYRRCGFTDLEEIAPSTIDYKMMVMLRHPFGGS